MKKGRIGMDIEQSITVENVSNIEFSDIQRRNNNILIYNNKRHNLYLYTSRFQQYVFFNVVPIIYNNKEN